MIKTNLIQNLTNVLIVLVISNLLPISLYGQLNSSWNLTVGGQTIQANPDGSFRIPNISSPDLNADFIADDYVRLTGYSTTNGNTQYVYSDNFRIESGQTVVVPELIFTPFPAPNPDSIDLGIAEGSSRVLTQIDQTSQLQVLGKFESLPENCSPVGNSCDLTSSQNWTTYRSSNPKIASVDSDGLVTANGCGIALITAKNDGVTTVTKITVSVGDELTAVEGFVFDFWGNPANGAIVSTKFGHEVISNELGFYSIPGVPAEQGDIFLEFDLSEPLSSFCHGPVKPLPGGISDAGVVTLPDNIDWSFCICEADPLEEGLLAYFPFDGNVNDESGNGKHGVAQGGAELTVDRFGDPNSAYSLDDENALLYIPHSIEAPVFSISVWIRTDHPGGNESFSRDRETLWTSDPNNNSCSHGYTMFLYQGSSYPSLDPTRNCRDGSTLSSEKKLNDGEWHHIVFIYDGQKIYQYVDSERQEIERNTRYALSNGPIRIGRSRPTPYPYTGDIDDIRVYNRVLCDLEIQSLFEED